MRKIILTLAVSLDGYIEGPNRETDWIVFDKEGGDVLNRFLKEIDTILYGRVCYETWGTYIPPESASPFEKEIYTATGKMKKYVFSSARNTLEGNPAIISSNIRESVLKIKQEPGKNIWLYGGSGLISTLMNLDLVDEFRLAVIPVILGSGTPLFKKIKNRIGLTLKKVRAGKSGVLELRYEKVSHL